MWIGHFKVWHENCIYLTNSSKFNVVISMYPLNSYVEGKYRYHTNVNILSGSHDDIKQFITAIKKDKRCLEFKGSGNVYVSYMRMKLSDYHTTNYYTPKIFLLKPIIHKDGKEEWYFGAWEREIVSDLYNSFKKFFHVEMLSIKEQDFTDLFIPHIMPKITEKQKEAIQLAIREGYYDFPRNIHLNELSKITGVSRVTYLEHLRKAECKIIPEMFGYSIKEDKKKGKKKKKAYKSFTRKKIDSNK